MAISTAAIDCNRSVHEEPPDHPLQNAALHEAVPDAWYSPTVGPQAQRDARALRAVPTP